MKKVILLMTMVIAGCVAFCQPPLTKAEFLKRSKDQRNVGLVLAVTGTGLAFAGGIAWTDGLSSGFDWANPGSGAEAMDKGRNIFIIGTIVAACSIPCFVASASNKKKAMRLSLDMKSIPLVHPNGLINAPAPTVSVKIPL